MTIRYLFFVFVTLCTSGIASLCVATPIVADYSVIPKTLYNPSSESKQTLPDTLLSQQAANGLITQQRNNTAPQMPINTFSADLQPRDEFLRMKASPQEKNTTTHFNFDFDGLLQTNTLTENALPQQSNQPDQPDQNHTSVNVNNILQDTVKVNEVLKELVEGSVEVYRSFSDPSTVGGFQTASSTVSFGNETYGASRDFLDAPPLIASQQQAPSGQPSWGEETFFDKLIEFCLSWKGLLTLCGFLIFNSILFKLV